MTLKERLEEVKSEIHSIAGKKAYITRQLTELFEKNPVAIPSTKAWMQREQSRLNNEYSEFEARQAKLVKFKHSIEYEISIGKDGLPPKTDVNPVVKEEEL